MNLCNCSLARVVEVGGFDGARLVVNSASYKCSRECLRHEHMTSKTQTRLSCQLRMLSVFGWSASACATAAAQVVALPAGCGAGAGVAAAASTRLQQASQNPPRTLS